MALSSCFVTFDGIEFYPNTKDKISKIVVSLVRLHPFNDGNKRIALSIMFSLAGKHNVTIAPFDYTDLMNGIATKKYNEQDITRLLK